MGLRRHYRTSSRHPLAVRRIDWRVPAFSTSITPLLVALVTVLFLASPATSALLPDFGAFEPAAYAVLTAAVYWTAHQLSRTRREHVAAANAATVADRISDEIGYQLDGAELVALRWELRQCSRDVLVASRSVAPGVTLVVDCDDYAYALKEMS